MGIFSRDQIEYKTDAQIVEIRKSALIVADIHKSIKEIIAPGMTTADLDNVALQVLESHGVKSNFLGYYGYPKNTCISVNDTMVHGIPGKQVLQPGDLVSVDCGAVRNGWHADACFSVVLPGGDAEVSARRERLSEITHEALWRGIVAMARGKYVADIGNAIDDYVMSLAENERPDIVLDFTGHGIGTQMHLEPTVVNYRTAGRSPKLKAGMVLCIEPILTAGKQENRTLDDGWTVVTRDRKDACHWEHEIALHDEGIWVLSAPDGGASELARFGITPVPLA
ncbi:MAG: type I methionyl aminopeptidase [Actinomycetales bacterium]|nr:MAG: type I methionyl aminopeptidase [Actinomycetales bacterium]